MDTKRREFLGKAVIAMGSVGTAATGYMFLASMLPTREIAAFATVEVDLGDIAQGRAGMVAWQNSPVFIVHRTAQQIEQMQRSNGGKDPQPDAERVQKPQWLIVVGVCTHLGCIPIADQLGWRCPCHGSVFDLSGRVLSGPAPRNLEIPPYQFIDDQRVLIGKVSV